MEFAPYKLLKEAIKAVPAVRYALGIAGIASVIAIIAGLKIDFRVAIFGTIIIIGLMFILLIFSAIANQKSKIKLKIPALVMAWTFLLLTIMASTLLTTSFFFTWPRDIMSYFPDDNDRIEIVIKGNIMSIDKLPVIDADITIDGYKFFIKSNEHGEFMSALRDVRLGEIITLRVYHKDYKSISISRKIQSTEEYFNATLEKRNDS